MIVKMMWSLADMMLWNLSNQAKDLLQESRGLVRTVQPMPVTHFGSPVLTIWELFNRILQSMCQLMVVSEVMVLLRNVAANGLGLLILWVPLVVQLMVCKSSMAVCFVTSTRLMRSVFAMVVRSTFKMVIHDGLVGLAMETMGP